MITPGTGPLFATAMLALVGSQGDAARSRIKELRAREPDELLPAGVMSAAMVSKTAVFEEQVHAWTTCIHAVAEGWYLPMLEVAVDLARCANGREPTRWRRPVMLGGVMATARRDWAVPQFEGMLALLHPNVKAIRNSRAHFTQKFDIPNATVSFITVSRGQKAVLGPWTKDDVARLGGQLLTTCMCTKAAFDLLDSDEVIETFKEHGTFTGLMRHLVNPLRAGSGLPPGPEHAGEHEGV